MDFLLNPNVAYVILLAGVILAFFAASTPGTGVGELASLFCFVLAGYAAYNLSIHWWALAILFLSVIPFVFAVRKPGQLWYLGLSIFMLVVGSVFLFGNGESLLSVNPILALFGSALMSVLLWYLVRKFVEVTSRRPVHDFDALVGQVGTARTAVHDDGSVYVNGELWSARSQLEIPSGSHVKVVGRDGFVLVVEKA